MSLWAVADRAIPFLLLLIGYVAGFRLGRTWEQLQQFLDHADHENGNLL